MSAGKTPPVVCFVGRSGSGKTTFIVKLIPELKKRGVRVAAVKRAHPAFEIDYPGKDSFRMREAGADVVVVSAGQKKAVVERTDREAEIHEIAAELGGRADLVIAEGYRRSAMPKIEVVRGSGGEPPLCAGDCGLVAMVTDEAVKTSVPVFGLDDAAGVANFLVEKYLGTKG